MSTAQLTTSTPVTVPEQIPRQLQSLRNQSKAYALLSGLLLLVITLVIVYWGTTLLDEVWFSIQKLELPRTFRIAVSSVLCGGLIWLVFRHLLKPGFRRLSDTDMALLIERRFPHFQDRLITVVESRQAYPGSGTHVKSMLNRTASQAQQLLNSVSLQNIFDTQPLVRRGWVAGILLLTVAAHLWISPGAISRWWSAFVSWEHTYHIRTTELDFTILADPGERPIRFSNPDSQPLYRHPRGSDLQLLIEVPERKQSDTPWVVPERVRVDVMREDGTSSRSYVSKSSDDTFRFILTRLQENISIEVLGGDYRTPLPLQIEAASPPAIDQLSAVCVYPEYTGWNEERGPDVDILSSELSLPTGTQFSLRATSSKKLQGIRIVSDTFEISGDADGGQLVSRDESKVISQDLLPLLTEDGLGFQASFKLLPNELMEDSDSALADDSTVILPSNTSLKFFLHDQDNIMTATPESLRLTAIPDKAPVIAVRQQGVTNAVTRRAVIPMTGKIRDDYRVAAAEFRFLVDDESEWRRRPLRSGFRPGLEFELSESGRDRDHFAVQPLDLTEGQTLAITVYAEDECDLPEPNQSRAEPMVFRIVSDQELLSLMYSQELALRRRFEEVIAKLEQTEADLIFHQEIAERLDTQQGTPEQKAADRASLNRTADSAGNTLRRQKNELDAINKAFQDIAQQLINNAITPALMAEQMQTQVIDRLTATSETTIPEADRSLSRFRVAADKSLSTVELLPKAKQDVRNVIDELRIILEQVRDTAEYHELISGLKNLLDEQKRLQNETKRQQIKNLGGF